MGYVGQMTMDRIEIQWGDDTDTTNRPLISFMVYGMLLGYNWHCDFSALLSKIGVMSLVVASLVFKIMKTFKKRWNGLSLWCGLKIWGLKYPV
jgi:hypothetical protein